MLKTIPTILKFSWLSLLFVAISCSQNTNNKQILTANQDYPKFNSKQLIAIDSIHFTDSVHKYFVWKKLGEDKLIAIPNSGQKLVHVYSYPDFTSLGAHLQRGRGENEYITRNWAATPDPNEFILYDIMRKGLYTYTVNNFGEVMQKEYFPLYLDTANTANAMTKPFTFIQRIKGDEFLMKVNDRNNAYFERSNLAKGTVIETIPLTPLEEQSDEKFDYYKYHFQTLLHEKHLLKYYSEMDRLEFLKINAKGILENFVSYGNTEPPLEDEETDFLFYIDAQNEGSDVFLLKLIQDEKGNRIGSAIEHFKMDGTPVAKYVFDRAVSLAHVDLKLKKIFAYEQQMDKDQIVVYDLP